MSKFDSPQQTPQTPYSRGSYFDRAADGVSQPEKEALASFVATHLVSPDEHVFLSTGSTVCLAGERILTRVTGANILTNSVPLAARFMELSHRGALAPLASVDLMGGPVNATTGMIGSLAFTKTQCTKVFLAPHGINRSGLVGDRDVPFLKKAISAYHEVVLLATWDKLFRNGKEHLKKPGHIAKEIRNGRRYRLVVPAFLPKHFSPEKLAACEEFLEWLTSEIGMVVHRAPESN